MMPSKLLIESRLITNPYWRDLREGEQEKWLNIFKFTLDKLEAETDNEYAMKVFSVIDHQLLTARWDTRVPIFIFNGMIKKAKLKIAKEEEKEPKKIADLVKSIIEPSQTNKRFI